MQTTNKRIALITLLIGLVAIAGLFITEHISIEQSRVLISPLLIGCIALMGFDAFYDFLGIVFRAGETIVQLTPSTEDDKRLAELKALVEQLQVRTANDETAVGGLVLEWLGNNRDWLPELLVNKPVIESKPITETVTTTTTVTPFTTEIAGTSHSFPTVADDDKAAG